MKNKIILDLDLFKMNKWWLSNKCNCGKKISYQSKHCASCAAKIRKITDEGRQKRSISSKGDKNNAYIDGHTLKKYYCLDCKQVINWQTFWKGSKRCRSCATKEKYKNPKNHPNFNKGISLIINYCKSCGQELADYRAIRCQSCETIRRYENGILSIKPNKPEKILIDLLPNNFKYVGNGSLWIDKFNPDFIDNKNKKIIEMFGDYWHNLSKSIIRDRLRLKTYKKYGYKTLIIWEHELKDLIKLSSKLEKFYE